MTKLRLENLHLNPQGRALAQSALTELPKYGEGIVFCLPFCSLETQSNTLPRLPASSRSPDSTPELSICFVSIGHLLGSAAHSSLTIPAKPGHTTQIFATQRGTHISILEAQKSHRRIAVTTVATTGLATIPLQKSQGYLLRRPQKNR